RHVIQLGRPQIAWDNPSSSLRAEAGHCVDATTASRRPGIRRLREKVAKLGPNDRHLRGRFDAEANLIAMHFDDGQRDTRTDEYPFAGFSAENKHDLPP